MAHTFIPSRGRPSLQQTLDSKKGKKANPNPCVWAFEWESEAQGSGNKQNNGVSSTMKGTGLFFNLFIALTFIYYNM